MYRFDSPAKLAILYPPGMTNCATGLSTTVVSMLNQVFPGRIDMNHTKGRQNYFLDDEHQKQTTRERQNCFLEVSIRNGNG